MNLFNFILNIFDRYDVKKVISTQQLTEINKIKDIIKKSGSFLEPRKRIIKNYTELFKILEKIPNFYGMFFKISRVLGVNSANGRTFVINLKSGNVENSELIVKIPLSNVDGDSLSYEYYIGSTLNKLREDGVCPIFSLLYGRVMCGVNKIFEQKKSNNLEFVDIPKESLDNETVKMCDSIFDNNKRMHLIYEYIRNVDTSKNISFGDYIERLSLVNNKDELSKLEMNIIKIMIIVMYSLQVAHDRLGFTHYDLHPGNIMLVESENPVKFIIRYEKKNIEIVSNIIPYIIDYGRCYVTPNQVVPEEELGYYTDIENGNTYCNFEDYQKKLFNNFMVVDLEKYNDNVIDMNDMVWNYLQDVKSKKKLTDDEIEKSQKIIIDSILNRNIDRKEKDYNKNKDYNKDDYTNYFRTKSNRIFLKQYDFGIGPRSNEKYDFFRLTKTIIQDLLTTQLANNMSLHYIDMWHLLNEQLSVEYPFYDEEYFSLPCDYHITSYNSITTKKGVWNHWIKHPFDIGKILYNTVKSDIKPKEPKEFYERMIHYNIGNGSSYRDRDIEKSENLLFKQIAGRVYKKSVITKNMQKTENKLKQFVYKTEDMNSEEYEESDLMKKITEYVKIHGLPKFVIEGKKSRMPAPWPKKK